MNPDQQLIASAYEDAVKALYGKLFEGYEEAGGAPEAELQAERNFSAGIALARKARDRATALLAENQTAHA